jgi:CubicO group peptidase (beta-lactamase class C family)
MKSRLLIFLVALGFATYSKAQVPSSAEIDQLAQKAIDGFGIPGVAIAIIKDGKVIHSKGYGVCSLQRSQKVDENTVFEIASNTKAFTAAAVGILVDEGKLSWDDKVQKYIPEFEMYDPYVSREFTIRDLLSHHSGLADGAGDLMILPDSTDFSIGDIIRNMKYLKPAYSFRTRFGYSNLLYTIAGEIVARRSGMSYDDFIEKRIMQPLGMNESAASYERLRDKSNVADAHALVNGKVQVVATNTLKRAHPAGGINASLADMEKWILLQLNDGKYGDKLDKQLFSAQVHTELWAPQTLLPVYPWMGYDTHFAAYAMGFEVYNIMGNNRFLRHGGSLDGMMSQVFMLPELHIGVIILTNQEAFLGLNAIANQIKDRCLGINDSDRISENLARYQKGMKADQDVKDSVEKSLQQIISKSGNNSEKEKTVVGRYEDVWMGTVLINKQNGKLMLSFKRSPKLTGNLYFYKDNTYVVKWNDRRMNADAYVKFETGKDGKASGFTLAAISPDTDFSFDFQDLTFKRSKE